MKPTIHDCYTATAQAFGVPLHYLYGRRRDHRIARARFAAWLIANDLVCESLPRIGRHAGRDHTTVSYGCERARRWLDEGDQDFSAAYATAHDAANCAGHREPVFISRRSKQPLDHAARHVQQ